MNVLFAQAEGGFRAVLYASGQAAVLACVVWAVLWLMGRQWSGQWRQALWVLVLIRLVTPWLPSSPLSMYGLSQYVPVTAMGPVISDVAPREPSEIPAVEAQAPQQSIPSRNWPSAGTVAACVWAVVAGGMVGCVGFRHFRFVRRLAKLPTATDPVLLEALEECKRLLGTGKRITPVITPKVTGPVLLGIFRPRLLLPPDWHVSLATPHLQHVLLHEVAHARRNDLLWGWLWAIATVVHWFNPFAWVARAQFLREQELACDASVLWVLKPGQGPLYGQTLLCQARQARRSPLRLGAAGLIERTTNVERRIVMAASYEDRRKRRWFWAAAVLPVMVLLGLTDVKAAAPRPDTILPGRGVVGLHLGDRAEAIRAKLGDPDDQKEDRVSYKKKYGMELTLENGRIVEMRFNKGYTGKTPDGIEVGSSIEDAVNANGGVTRVVKTNAKESMEEKAGSIHVLYEIGNGQKYQLTDGGRGVTYWADRHKRITQIVVYKPKVQATVKLNGGTLAGQPLSADHMAITVSPDQAIAGEVMYTTVNPMHPGAVAVLGYTWTWGKREQSLELVDGDIPSGTKEWNTKVELKAPDSPGTYHLIFSFNGEFSLDEVMSSTNWSAQEALRNGGNGFLELKKDDVSSVQADKVISSSYSSEQEGIWNDGNDVWDLKKDDISRAQAQGFVSQWPYLFKDGMKAADIPIMPITINVK